MGKPPSIHDPRYKQMIKTIVRLRKDAALSQGDLASAIGMSQPDISKIERLERRLDVLEFFLISKTISNHLDKNISDAMEKVYESISEY